MVRVLFVCMGNICRSPVAEGVFTEQVRAAGLSHLISADSAGTHAYHTGSAPDRRARAAALARGINISAQRARPVDIKDFHDFDYVLAMDRANLADLKYICPSECASKLRLCLDFAPELARADVPDPYYGGAQGFELVLDLVSRAAEGLLEEIRSQQM
jgi:protein-tyrosine phosphatase